MSQSLQEAKSFLMPHGGYQCFVDPINSKAEASLVPYKVSKIPMRRISRRERGAGLAAWNCLAHFQLQVACDVLRKQQQRQKNNQKLTKNGGNSGLKDFIRITFKLSSFFFWGVFFVIHRHSWHTGRSFEQQKIPSRRITQPCSSS